ncbi:MAG: TolC family protein [Gemmatimonadales bacterium]
MRLTHLLPLLSLLILATTDAIGQQVTLAEALSLARQHNTDYRKAQNDAGATGLAATAGRLWFLPSLNASFDFGASTTTNTTVADVDGRPIPLPSPVNFESSSASQRISTSLILFDGLRNVRGARVASARARATDATADATAIRVDAQVTRQFLTALRQQRLIQVEERLLASQRDQLAATERLFRTASANQVDVLGAQVAVAQQEQALANQRGEAEKAGLELARVIGLDEITPLSPSGDLPTAFDPATLSVDVLVASATAQSPRIRQLEASADAANAEAGSSYGARWPTISASAGLTRSLILPNYSAFGELNPQNRSLGFSLSIQVPIFTRFQTSANIVAANARADNADEDLRAGLLQIETDVRLAVVDLRNAYQALVLAERSAELSATRMTLAQEQYRLGAIQYQNLQQVIDGAAQTERQAVGARFNFALALVTLEELVGSEVRP